MRDQGGNFQVYGVDGVNLAQRWGEKPEAYYGISISKMNLISRYRSESVPQLSRHVWSQFGRTVGESYDRF